MNELFTWVSSFLFCPLFSCRLAFYMFLFWCASLFYVTRMSMSGCMWLGCFYAYVIPTHAFLYARCFLIYFLKHYYISSPTVNNEEMERTTMVLQRMQSTYQNQLSHYREQEAATTLLIKQLKEERQAAEDKSKMGLERI